MSFHERLGGGSEGYILELELAQSVPVALQSPTDINESQDLLEALNGDSRHSSAKEKELSQFILTQLLKNLPEPSNHWVVLVELTPVLRVLFPVLNINFWHSIH